MVRRCSMLGAGARGFAAWAIAALAGCGFFLQDRIHYAADASIADGDRAPDPAPGAIVGVAFSGGGSRAAVFGAAVLRALDRRGVGPQITHLSSVSGGSFAASYFALRGPSACARSDGDCREAYFDDFLGAMRRNYWSGVVIGQLTHPGRITSPTRRASSLEEALDAGFVDGATFGDLPSRPVLLINAAGYHDLRRFVFSGASIEAAYGPPFERDALRLRSFSRPGCPRATPDDFPLALAVAASAAVPAVFGPVLIQLPETCAGGAPEFWRLGDGGIIDNSGVETLREIAVRGVLDGDTASALLFEIDAGAPIEPERAFATRSLNLFTSTPGVAFDMAQAAGQAYSQLFWTETLSELPAPVDVIRFEFTDAAIDRWPFACRPELRRDADIAVHLRRIPTSLSISDCDAELLEAAAEDVVGRVLAHEVATLARHGLTALE